jgi:hypothetical protein
MVPTYVVIPVFLVSFVLTLCQYILIDPRRRILNIRFGLMVCASVGAIGYPVYNLFYSPDRHASWLFLAAGLFVLGASYHLFRHMPPRDIR